MLVTATPTEDGVDTGVEFAFDPAMGKAIGAAQDDAGTLYVSLRRRTLPDNALQAFPVARPQP